MSEKIKAVRGSKDRADEVKIWLINQGAKDFKTYNFKGEDNFYYVVDGTVNFVTDEYKNLVDIVELKPKLKVIRGVNSVNSRYEGKRIIAALENLGGRNIDWYIGDASYGSCYYINNENKICCDSIDNLNKKYELEFIELPEKNKYEFKPFDKVLVRDNNKEPWRCTFFSHTSCSSEHPYFCTNNIGWAECIPYEGNEYIVGKITD